MPRADIQREKLKYIVPSPRQRNVSRTMAVVGQADERETVGYYYKTPLGFPTCARCRRETFRWHRLIKSRMLRTDQVEGDHRVLCDLEVLKDTPREGIAFDDELRSLRRKKYVYIFSSSPGRLEERYFHFTRSKDEKKISS